MRLAQNDRCIFENHIVYLYKSTKPIADQHECKEDIYRGKLEKAITTRSNYLVGIATD